jgi:arylsulfatase A-like enzyme
MPLTFLNKSRDFIRQHRNEPFFLFYSLTEPHVPRMPSTVFKGKSGLGYRGDAILQIDWAVGEIMNELKDLGLDKNTMVIFSSDNGPVLDDGYEDEAVTKLNGHRPWGPLRGGKYSTFEAGTRVPFIVRWSGSIKPGISDAMLSQSDLLASFSAMLGRKSITADSQNMWAALTGKTMTGRTTYVEQGMGSLAIISGDWKYIEPGNGPAITHLTNIETGNNAMPQLYNLKEDIGEINNLAEKFPEKVTELQKELERIRKN